MIYSISGKVTARKKGFAIIEAGGVGYKILMPQRQIDALPKSNEKTVVFCFQKLNRDGYELYGFPTEKELEIFELLTGITGIGAKAALKIIESLDGKKLFSAAETGRSDILSEIPGIGKKKAGRIMFELQEKIFGHAIAEDKELLKGNAGTEKALRSLGYSREEIKEAIKKIPEQETDLENKIKFALKCLAKTK